MSVFGSQVFGQALIHSCEIRWFLVLLTFWREGKKYHRQSKCVMKHTYKLEPHLVLKQDLFSSGKLNFITKNSFAHYLFNGTLETFVVPIEADLQQLPCRVIFGNPAYGWNWLSTFAENSTGKILLGGKCPFVRTKKLSGQKNCLDKKNCPDKKIVWTTKLSRQILFCLCYQCPFLC